MAFWLIARRLQGGYQGVHCSCQFISRWLLGCFGWLLKCCILRGCQRVVTTLLGSYYGILVGCQKVARWLLVVDSCQYISRWLLGCYEWLLKCCILVGCQGIARTLLGGCWQLLQRSAVRFPPVEFNGTCNHSCSGWVARTQQEHHQVVTMAFWLAARWLLECSGWLLEHFQVVTGWFLEHNQKDASW